MDAKGKLQNKVPDFAYEQDHWGWLILYHERGYRLDEARVAQKFKRQSTPLTERDRRFIADVYIHPRKRKRGRRPLSREDKLRRQQESDIQFFLTMNAALKIDPDWQHWERHLYWATEKSAKERYSRGKKAYADVLREFDEMVRVAARYMDTPFEQYRAETIRVLCGDT